MPPHANQIIPPTTNPFIDDNNNNLCNRVTGLTQPKQPVLTVHGSGMYKLYSNPWLNPNSLIMGRPSLFVPMSTTGTSVPMPHSTLMAPPITSRSKGNSQRNRDSNINQGRQRIVPSPSKMKTQSQTRGKRSRIYRDYPEDLPDDPDDFWEEETIVRERNAKRARNTSCNSSDNEPVAQRQKMAYKEHFPTQHFQTHQQTQNKKQQQSQQITQQQEKKIPYTPVSSPNKFITAYDDFAFSKNPAGNGIEFGNLCRKCGLVCVSWEGWSAHQYGHSGEGIKCTFCPQVFLTHHARDAHQQLHRDGRRVVEDSCECGLCGGSFIAIMYLELHLLELHGRESLQDPRVLHLHGPPAQDPSHS